MRPPASTPTRSSSRFPSPSASSTGRAGSSAFNAAGRAVIGGPRPGGRARSDLFSFISDHNHRRREGEPRARLRGRGARAPDGPPRAGHFETVYSPVRGPDGDVAVVSIRVADVTARETALADLAALNATLEQRVAERSSELERLNAELARAARAKDAFLASMSHELRTPLTGILGAAELLRAGAHGPLNDRQLRTLGFLEEAGRHLLSLLSDILDLARIGAEGSRSRPTRAPSARSASRRSTSCAGRRSGRGSRWRSMVRPLRSAFVGDARGSARSS